MSFNFGQIRKTQIDSFLKTLPYSIVDIRTDSAIAKNVYFIDKAVRLEDDNVFNYINDKRTENYYLRVRIKKQESKQNIMVKLQNINKTKENTQRLDEIEIDAGSGYSNFEFVISPNNIYHQVVFELERNEIDYSLAPDNDNKGREIIIEVEALYKINNVIDKIGSSINNQTQLRQIGVQSAPGLLMCIDGEPIKVGRSGIYEINNGISINFIGFIIEDTDNKFFLLDYQY